MTPRSYKNWFTLLLVALALAVLLETFSLSRIARMVPLWVLAFTLPLLLLQVAADWIPGAAARLRMVRRQDLFSTESLRKKAPANLVASQSGGTQAPGLALLWVLGLPVLIYMMGIVIALPLHAFFYLVVRSKESVRTAFVVAIVLGGITAGALHILGG
jgi:hypothetical protein